MAESVVPSIPLTLDKPRHLRLDNRALFRCERELVQIWGTKTSMLSILMDLGNIRLNDLAVMLWVGLLHEDPTLTLEETQDLMDFSKLSDILGAILQAWNAATLPADPQAVPEGEGDGDPLASNGLVSGRTPVSSLA